MRAPDISTRLLPSPDELSKLHWPLVPLLSLSDPKVTMVLEMVLEPRRAGIRRVDEVAFLHSTMLRPPKSQIEPPNATHRSCYHIEHL